MLEVAVPLESALQQILDSLLRFRPSQRGLKRSDGGEEPVGRRQRDMVDEILRGGDGTPVEVLRMEDSLPKIWRNHIVSSKACIVESGLIGVDRYAAGVLDNYRLRYGVGNPPKFAFILPQSLLTLLEVFDVSAYSVPHNDLPGFVAEGFEANEEPTKDPIMAAHARFDFAWFSGNQQLAPSPHQ